MKNRSVWIHVFHSYLAPQCLFDVKIEKVINSNFVWTHVKVFLMRVQTNEWVKILLSVGKRTNL